MKNDIKIWYKNNIQCVEKFIMINICMLFHLTVKSIDKLLFNK